MIQKINGDLAFAYAARDAGVKIAVSYPGSPSSGTMDVLIELAENDDIHVQWSANEKVAMEVGIGASIAGRRALVCTKSVGMNLMLDPLMALNLTPVNAGLVILLGDDPGGYGSQNDQDTRSLAPMLEMPMMEPATPAEAYAMMREAFSLSERLNTAVIIRETRSFAQQVGRVDTADKPKTVHLGFTREPYRYVPVPLNVVEKHRFLHEQLERFGEWADKSPFNHVSGSGTRGVIGAGFVYQKLLDVTGKEPTADFRVLKLGVLFPLPEETVARFLSDCDEVLVVEETEPFVETHIKAIAHDHGCKTKIYGKRSKHISREGELFRWQIHEALSRFLPGFVPDRRYTRENEIRERPEMQSYCGGCRYDEVLDVLDEAAAALQQKIVLVGDPGCLVTVADKLEAKYAIGSAVGVADGMSKAGIEERPVAVFGDSSFFHTSLPAICNAVYDRSDILMVVLDNSATRTSGFQPHPGVGRDALGKETPKLSIEKIAHACGVPFIRNVALEPKSNLKDNFQEALSQDKLALLVVRLPRVQRTKLTKHTG
ncbi:MAG: thiamine pyrophosphate-dependent enzyme [bacterium]